MHDVVFAMNRPAAPLAVPPSPVGLVVLAQCGRSRRDAEIAELVAQRGFATVLLDLPVADDHDDVEMIAEHVLAAIDHIRSTHVHRGLPIGLFGSTVGGTAALIAAARRTDLVTAVVALSARLDLLGPRLSAIRTPTLLVAGSRDTANLRAMRDAALLMVAPHQVAVISGATERFDEPGALEEVAAAACTWLLGYFLAPHPSFAGATAR